MNKLPVFQSAFRDLMLIQTNWKGIIDNALNSPIIDGNLLTGVALASGANVINHKLGRALQGWLIVGNNANVTVYDTQASNSTPNLTLQLTASGAATVSLWCF